MYLRHQPSLRRHHSSLFLANFDRIFQRMYVLTFWNTLLLEVLILSLINVVPSDAVMAPPIFGRSVNPIQTGKGGLSPPITTGTPKVFHLPASLPSLGREK